METTRAFLLRVIEETKIQKGEMIRLGFSFMTGLADILIADYERQLAELPEEEKSL
jgi:hypothetical protein